MLTLAHTPLEIDTRRGKKGQFPLRSINIPLTIIRSLIQYSSYISAISIVTTVTTSLAFQRPVKNSFVTSCHFPLLSAYIPVKNSPVTSCHFHFLIFSSKYYFYHPHLSPVTTVTTRIFLFSLPIDLSQTVPRSVPATGVPTTNVPRTITLLHLSLCCVITQMLSVTCHKTSLLSVNHHPNPVGAAFMRLRAIHCTVQTVTMNLDKVLPSVICVSFL